ncbi:MAG: PqqD family protein [Halioglobus sp.]|nr:PqqD family protein [Halioglobus sp.]
MADQATPDLLALTPRLRYRAVGDEGVVVHLDRGRVTVVNELGLHIIRLLQQPMSRESLVTAIVTEFEVGAAEAEADLARFLDELAAEQLLAPPAS